MTVLEVCSPLDRTLLSTVPVTAPEDVPLVVEELRRAQPAWASLPVRERVRWMRRYRDWLHDNERLLNDLLGAETGKPAAEVGVELVTVQGLLHYYCSRAEGFLADSTPRPSSPLTALKRLRVRYVPHQVVGVIGPWNFPLAVPLWDAIPALLAGASVAVKPSEHTPLAATAAVKGWLEIGAPPVIVAVNGPGTTGAALVDAADYVSFTGSTPTGRAIATQAAARFTPYSLELGGNDPAIVLADANVEQTARGLLLGGLANSGQMCVAVERVYVVDELHDRLVARVADLARELRFGPRREDTDLSGLVTAQQLEIVQEHVEDAVRKGAEVVVGGRPTGHGQGYEPTVLIGVDHTMTVMREETFGPVLPIMRVHSVDEAVRLANDSEFGLSASIWGGDKAAARAVARRLEAGTVTINDAATHVLCHPVPQAGWKASGVGGRFGGAAGIRKYTKTQAFTENRVELALASTLVGFPYTTAKSGVIRKVGRLADAGSFARRLRG